ncbi:MFS transporter [Enterovirga rhinocerotis]|uniref:Putative MFS family arabinose efflux permease n=1 Tax=Enterovirga rhinocerotis TaxID=1339210 RepID=A0A4R7CAR1_9HYPH|nr:MFS transporter [Enterovirga rhinocerotis]TDR94106.1 putative MFS family arabinose efflux permease [Enterovirga rhinocerotis]
MATTTPPSATGGPSSWRHQAAVLAVAQALGGANPSIVVALGGLVGARLAPDQTYATLPVSMLQFGIALGTLPAAYLMNRLGRRGGYLIGGAVGVLAGAVAATGISVGSFLIFCLGTLMAGLYSSYVQSYRFAAADDASPADRPRAISWVMTGGILAGIIGPQTVIWTSDLIPEAPFAGGFLGQAALALISILVISQLRSRRPAPVQATATRRGRPLMQIVRQRRFVLSVIAGLVSYGLMSFVMTAAPLAMVMECGLSVSSATLGIQWHILAMFGPSLLTGRLIARFGKVQITVVGLLLIAASAVVGLMGRDVAHFWAALILVGLGWNLGFIGATSLVTDCYEPEERAKVQAANDFLVFGTVAIASFASGTLQMTGGWAMVNWLVFPFVAVALVALMLPDRSGRLRPS